MRKYERPYPGKIYDSWTVVRLLNKNKGTVGKTILVRCRCGSERTILTNNLVTGKSRCCRDCGTERGGLVNRKYADLIPNHNVRIKIMRCVNGAIQRCRDVNYRQYKDYGGRGIQVKFESRESFVRYLLTLPGHNIDILCLDRIDNDGHYEPGNLRFVTRSKNQNNRRNSLNKPLTCKLQRV